MIQWMLLPQALQSVRSVSGALTGRGIRVKSLPSSASQPSSIHHAQFLTLSPPSALYSPEVTSSFVITHFANSAFSYMPSWRESCQFGLLQRTWKHLCSSTRTITCHIDFCSIKPKQSEAIKTYLFRSLLGVVCLYMICYT